MSEVGEILRENPPVPNAESLSAQVTNVMEDDFEENTKISETSEYDNTSNNNTETNEGDIHFDIDKLLPSDTGKSKFPEKSLVWTRLGKSWWPGLVVALYKCPEDFLKDLRKTPIAVVKFFHENG